MAPLKKSEELYRIRAVTAIFASLGFYEYMQKSPPSSNKQFSVTETVLTQFPKNSTWPYVIDSIVLLPLLIIVRVKTQKEMLRADATLLLFVRACVCICARVCVLVCVCVCVGECAY